MAIALPLDSYKLAKVGKKPSETPPDIMPWPQYEWPFTLTDGLELAIQTQSRYYNVVHMSSIGDTVVDLGRCIFDFNGSLLKVTTEFRYAGWFCQTVYAKKLCEMDD